MISRLFGFFDNDRMYNLVVPITFAVIVLSNVIGGYIITIDDSSSGIVFPLYMFLFFWTIAAMIALEHHDLIENTPAYNFIDTTIMAMHSIWGVIVFAVLLIIPVVVAGKIFSEKRIKLYRRLMVFEYIVMAIISVLYFVSFIIFCIMSFSVISAIALVVSMAFSYLIYRIIKHGIRITLSDNILNFCKDRA